MATRTLASGTTVTANTTGGIRAFAGELEAIFSAGGFVQTTDTGQTAVASLVAASTTNQSMGYQVWRMNDSLQSTAPVFFKIEYGSGANGAAPSLWLTIGTGSDGSGNITGAILARTQVCPCSSAWSTGSGYSSAGDASWFTYNLTGAATLLLSLERTHDAAGNDTSEGVLVFSEGTSVGAALAITLQQVFRFANNTLPNSTTLGAALPSGTTYADGTNVGVSPVRFHQGGPSNPSKCWMAYMNGDIANGSAVTVSLYSGSHTFMPLGSSRVTTAIPSQANATLMQRFE